MRSAGIRPLVIAHRGASGYRPEHTLAAYQLALDQGADFVEPDLVATRDRRLICRHENALAVLREDGSLDRERTSTDIPARVEFADRCTTKCVDGEWVRGWFSEDLTLEEIGRLRAVERLPALRPDNTRWDGHYGIPTFAEVLALVAQHARRTGHRAGVYPETKHPSWFRTEGHYLDGRHIGLDLGELLVGELLAADFTDPSRVFIQSFETANLRDLHSRILPAAGLELPLVQLMSPHFPPRDTVLAGAPLLWDREADVAALARHVQALGVERSLAMPATEELPPPWPGGLVAAAHAHGLDVHVWTLRAENHFLSAPFRRGTAPTAHGDLGGELRALRAAGVDGFFTDFPDLARAALTD